MIRSESGGGPYQSTLWMATQEPELNEFLGYLSRKKDELLEKPNADHVFFFNEDHVQRVRKEFSRMILKGEERLHRLCGLFADHFMASDYFLKSVVIGRNAEEESFYLSQGITEDEIYKTTDLDLGRRLLGRMKFQKGDTWVLPSLVANFVEYQSASTNEFQIHKMVSRIKAEEEIWAKAVDEIFQLDQIVSRDKKLRKLSFYIKDIFGVKFVVSKSHHVPRLLSALENFRGDNRNDEIRIIEVKNHLGLQKQKKSGWQALKVVVAWQGKVFEIQIQPLEVYLREQEYLTGESHAGFKERRERIRNEVAQKLPLFGFYVELLKWLFINPHQKPPQMSGIRVELDNSKNQLTSPEPDLSS
ncbi:hypothetical protein [Pseudobacteriovorax antillogorgiicola]|uniref:Uncharacterized protein n=1 Tax=Pseudobacteriovorax antillogorgiicola TaxID=1513793 RepID=A0A1Y6BJ01_9BACT|nr:hypothetical protein [Pseudobacteriovorax antillogorgiicola]TCS56388.1 RelA/SpoT family protein [Pseudobacteriovorax antillogorgiicola]SMF06269.1 hypothetical protein SAMN06296036_104123 [Pseudobacteriovorax antillogorgiicola]